MPKTSAHKVWESTQQDVSPDPEIRQFYQIIEKQLSQEKAGKNVQSDVLVHEPQNILVVAPHPDDEILCCATHLREHLAKGDNVFIVFVTNGDGKDDQNAEDSLNYGEQRKKESLRAAKKLGIPTRNLFFLGFPDRHLADIEEKQSSRSIFTHLVQTMRSSLFPGTPYTWNGLQQSLKKVLQKSTPTIIYMPGQEDQHLDHQVAARAIRVAADSLSDITPEWREYVVHSEEYVCVPQEVDMEKLSLIREFKTQRHDRYHTEFLEQFASCEEKFNQ